MHTGFRRGRWVVAAVFPALAAAVLITGAAPAAAQDRDFAPVTDAMLQDPDPADWLNWRRTLDGWGYSPLDQIDRGNVHRLQLAWAWSMPAGVSQPTPLVYDGVMYITGAANIVQAVDAATGDRIWEYRHDLSAMVETVLSPRSRSIAIYGDKVYLNTADAHIVALDARTGEVAWDHEVADNALGYRYTSGPIVANGKVVAGMTGCERFKEDVCFISAHDAETGEELWRTSTIARPGEPGGDTWGDLPLLYRAGADSWIPGSYDPESNLTFWSTSQAKPWASLTRGTDGDALYSNSVLALDADTGELSWYFLFTPAETHDLDDVFESVLIDHDGRRSLFKMGKLGILWELDRDTGAFVAAHDLGYQDVLDVDPETGRSVYRPEKMPVKDVELAFCPDFGGIRNWRASAYHPETQALYIPIHPTCVSGAFTEIELVPGASYLPEHGMAVAGQHRASRQRAVPRPPHRDGDRDGAHPVATLDDDPPRGRRADDGRRPRGQRRHRPQPRRPRRGERGRAVPYAPARLGVGVPHHLRGRGAAAPGGAGGRGPHQRGLRLRVAGGGRRLSRSWRTSPLRRRVATRGIVRQAGWAPRRSRVAVTPAADRTFLAPCVPAVRESHRRPRGQAAAESTCPSARMRVAVTPAADRALLASCVAAARECHRRPARPGGGVRPARALASAIDCRGGGVRRAFRGALAAPTVLIGGNDVG